MIAAKASNIDMQDSDELKTKNNNFRLDMIRYVDNFPALDAKASSAC